MFRGRYQLHALDLIAIIQLNNRKDITMAKMT